MSSSDRNCKHWWWLWCKIIFWIVRWCCKSVIDSFEWWMAAIWWHYLCFVSVVKHREHPRREESGTVESRGNEKQHYVQVGSNRRSWSP